MLSEALFVGIGGFLGAIARWQLSIFIQDSRAFPWGTIAVNFLGAILLGFIMEAALSYGFFTRMQRLFLATGFAGSFTTFSTFSYESIQLLKEYSFSWFLAYVLGSIFLGLAGVYIGVVMARVIFNGGVL